MVFYRRNRIAGGTYFFTVNLADRSARTLVEHHDLLRESWRETKRRWPFTSVAMVILPDHLHAIWTLPEADADFSTRWRSIKARFTRKLREAGVQIPKRRNGEFALWQRRFWEHTVRDELDLERHIAYIHYNPVKHGHVSNAAEWRHSTLHRYVRLGILPKDWGGEAPDADTSSFGE